LVLVILMIPALGPAVVKPCVAGTTARASAENVRSIGYSIYYTIVNIGGTLGPIMAWFVRKQLGLGMANVFRVASLSVFLMFLVTFFFFREPTQAGEERVPTVAAALKNMFVVLGNVRFVLFLVIFSSFYIVFWQEFVSAPLFLRGYVDPNANADLILSVDALTVICFQILVSFLTRKIPAFSAMTLGLLISSLSWLILAIHPSTVGLIACLVVLALGEITQSARYYEYISRLAPSGQQGLYMGYAFLPIAIGYFIAGPLGGYLLHEFGDVLHRPQQMWWVVTAVGIAGTVLMLIYDRVFKPGQAREPERSQAATG
jgi:MFS family permease